MNWTTALPDWQERIVTGESLIPCAPLFPDEAQAAIEVFGSLRIVDVPGEPTMAESAGPWLMDFAASIFGAYDADSGRRLIREFFLLVSKKNAKSTGAAGIMLTALIRGWRKSAEYLILAPTIEVAQNSFKPAADMVRADPELTDLLHVQHNLRTITNRLTGATLKVVAADNETVSGKKATGVLIEELWLFGRRSNAHAMLREATGGLVARPEGFVIYLTTQSDTPPAGVFKSRLDYFRDVRDGKVDDRRSLGVLYEFPPAMVEDQGYLDPENFHITNPNMGRSVSREWLAEELRKEIDGDDLQIFLAKHLNVEIGMNLRRDRWPGADFWQEAVEPGLTLDSLLGRCDVATIGIDGGGLDDLLGLAVMGRDKQTRNWLLWGRAWAHPIVLKRRKEIADTLRDFQRDGDLVICADTTQDLREVADLCVKVRDSGLLPSKDGIGVDKLGLPAIVDELIGRGFDVSANEGAITGISQGGFLNDAIMGVERKLADGTLRHAGQALMRWAVENARIEVKGNANSITKQVAGKAKIDPLVAALNAAKLMSLNPEAKREPQYQMLIYG